MTAAFKQARCDAGLSVGDAARLLSVDPVSIRRFEMDPEKKSARDAPPLLLRVLDWYTRQVPPQLPSA